MTPLPAGLPPCLPILGGGIALLMLCIAWRRSEARAILVALATLLLAFASLWRPALPWPGGPAATLLVPDGWFTYIAGLILLSSAATVIMAWRGTGTQADEFYLLLLLGTLGALVMAGSADMVALFLGLETLSLSLLGLIAWHRTQPTADEAAIKYLVLSGLSSAILLFGLALSYATTGSLRFAAPVPTGPDGPAIPLAATALILTGLFFKLSAVPFHTWLPDVMEGAPTPVAAFIAVVSKIALFAALARYFAGADLAHPGTATAELAIVAVLSMLGGNLLALGQTNLKRLLAGSSIAHVGYLLLALLSPGPFGLASAAFYLAAYSIATTGAFAAIRGADLSDIAGWRGMFRRRPALALAMAIMLVSLAGIPPAVGFFAKTYIVIAGVSAQRIVLLGALIAGSIIGLYYYLNIVRAMMESAPEDHHPARTLPAHAALIAALAIVTLAAGIFPETLVRQTRALLPPAPAHDILYGERT
ncbi:NADH-quinone oxidoreductase subunit N [Gluconacetobacter sacchari DSM 12717]|uniref:NADH-quinone oxidoreductase subunit N n=2 Tax=Gluconacetobacter sacchari TaxID=92759 RepID=A0A7W4ICX4_9PROT|nr:NADH-quinone oxidoreductase subunit N [Gluconacetobacter sacchari]MBB2160538.1 NADH-quinone oxidoreductase subunit N [Gluconacetobacter sacchari]GBQ32988.1 NADH-quinone oxidoreductase subunit N [Gluconacetobacter sacchari DSM 12717]